MQRTRCLRLDPCLVFIFNFFVLLLLLLLTMLTMVFDGFCRIIGRISRRGTWDWNVSIVIYPR